ncbi:MAG: hypothetical protein QOI95_2568 [Acidimicrobiaceae bacterium]|jgi:hypothetical protein
MTAWLHGEIEKSFVAPWRGATERSIFGDAGAQEIVEALDRACVTAFSSGLEDGFLYRVSVGCVIGCRLADGREVVLKAFQPRWTEAFLAAVQRVQSHLHLNGFPCPAPIGASLRVAGAVVLAEHVLVDPGLTTPTKEAMQPSAGGLARVVELCKNQREPALALHPLRPPDDHVFPEPHSPLFDFAATRAGAEWIDEIAAQAAVVRDEDNSEPVIAHTDWALRNVRLGTAGPVAVYDWDSLSLVPESHALGGAAATWCKTGEPGDTYAPSTEDIDEYITAYESARGAGLTSVQRRAARAAAVWTMAYTARCEHSMDPGEEVWTTTRPQLRADARALLS